MPSGAREDPFSTSKFIVEIEGIATSAFLEVTGIDARVAVEDYRNGSDKLSGVRKLPGEITFGNIVLKRGLTMDLSLWQWMQETVDGGVSRRNLAVVLLNDAGSAVLRFDIRNAWPVRWSAPDLNAESGDIAIETLEITHEGLTVAAAA